MRTFRAWPTCCGRAHRWPTSARYMEHGWIAKGRMELWAAPWTHKKLTLGRTTTAAAENTNLYALALSLCLCCSHKLSFRSLSLSLSLARAARVVYFLAWRMHALCMVFAVARQPDHCMA